MAIQSRPLKYRAPVLCLLSSMIIACNDGNGSGDNFCIGDAITCAIMNDGGGGTNDGQNIQFVEDLGSVSHPRWTSYCADAYRDANMQGAQYQLDQTGSNERRSVPSVLVNQISSLVIAPNCRLELYQDGGLKLTKRQDGRAGYFHEIAPNDKGDQYSCTCTGNGAGKYGSIVAWAWENEEGSPTAGDNTLPLFHNRVVDLNRIIGGKWKNRISAIEFLDSEYGSAMLYDDQQGKYSFLVPQMSTNNQAITYLSQDAGVGFDPEDPSTGPDQAVNWNNRINRIWAWGTTDGE